MNTPTRLSRRGVARRRPAAGGQGGLWQPDLTLPDPDCLAWYGRTYPITHTCQPASAGPDSTAQERP